MTIRIPIKHGRTSLKSYMFKILKSWKLNSFLKCDIISLYHLSNGKIGKQQYLECTFIIEIVFGNDLLRRKYSRPIFHLHHLFPQFLRPPTSPNSNPTCLLPPSECTSRNNLCLNECLRLIVCYTPWMIHRLQHRPLFMRE